MPLRKENFKPQIKLMIENVQDELYQLENKGHSSNPKDILKSVKKL